MSAAPRPCRVVLADDSALYRHLLRRVFDADPDVEVAGVAQDGAEALEMFRSAAPDAVVLDLNMPKLNGFEVLDAILSERPVPVFMISAGAAEDGGLAVRAVARGAVDLFVKPRGTPGSSPSDQLRALVGPVKAAGLNRPGVRREAAPPPSPPPSAPARSGAPSVRGREIIAIGASTGGIAAVLHVIKGLDASGPPLVLAQHMPVGFTKRLAQQFSPICDLEVVESEPGLALRPGRMVICASDDRHTVVRRSARGLVVESLDAPKEHHQRPAVDPLFRSVADVCGARALGILLTGMGKDGATGLLEMRRAGATTIAESEQSAAIFGMPRAAIELGAAEHVLDLDGIRSALTPTPRSPALASAREWVS